MLCTRLVPMQRVAFVLALAWFTLAAGAGLHAGPPRKVAEQGWQSLFDGKQLRGWQILKKEDFAGGGPVRVKDGNLVIGAGKPATGIRWTGKFPRVNYEIALEAQRVAGSDFFCGMTFPVQKGSLTLILGGWGGWVCGLSCIDGQYAINNDTARGVEFKNAKWYRIKLRVSDERVDVWVDDKQIIDLEVEGYKLSVSEEMKSCLPVGLATWKTTAAIRKLRWRPVVTKKK